MATSQDNSTVSTFNRSNPSIRIEPFTRQCDFAIWLKKFELLLKIAHVDESDKVNFLLTNLELVIFESVVTTFSCLDNYDEIVNFLKNRYSTQDKFLNRLEFLNISFTGSYDEFASKLQLLFENFSNDCREEILIAKFLTSVPKSVSTELRIRRPSTLSECVQLCNSLNSSKINGNFNTSAVSHSQKHVSHTQKPSFSKNFQRSDNKSEDRKCYRCGSSNHLASDSKCPAKNATCHSCGKVGHFSSVCHAKTNKFSDKQKHLNIRTNTYYSESEYFSDNLVEKPYVNLKIYADRSSTFSHTFLVDTGSDVCILPSNIFRRYFHRDIVPFMNAKLTNFDNSEIQVDGILRDVHCIFHDRQAKLDFLVCKSNVAVIGVNAISKLEICISGQTNELVTNSIERTDRPSFEKPEPVLSEKANSSRLPQMKGFQFYIKMKHDAPTSLISKPRRVPFTLESAIEDEIAKLLRNDIIEEIDSSPFLSPIVVVPKPDNSIRLCVDYKRINQHIVVDQHPLPTADEIFAKLSGAKIFSKLDLKSAYHQLLIREDSRNYTAFTSHIGQFRYKRLPFGLANAPSAYMKVLFNILKDCPNTVNYLDDILVYGRTLDEHNRNLDLTLKCLDEYGITLNESKCQYRQTSVQFLGRILSSEGISPLPKTLEAIRRAEVPQNKQSLRAFMGLVNFYRNFIPNAAMISSNLYELLKDNVHFTWTDVHQREFEKLKLALQNFVPLTFFDCDIRTETFLTTDASGYGISAVLSQKDSNGVERPVYFLSRKLSDNEKVYSATEKEFLAVLWGVERLHQYLYGRSFTIRTDHQCLKQLLCNGIEGGSAPCRVIRWATRLLYYNYSVEYLPGKQNIVADALSRVPHKAGDSHLELFAVDLLWEQPTPLSFQELKEATSDDDCLQAVVKLMKNGWPDRVSRVPEIARDFWIIRNELSFMNDVLRRNEKFIIPASLRDKVMNFAHEGHLGISKCKSRIREFFWWPHLNQSVENQLRSCSCCHEVLRDSPVQIPNYVNKSWHQLAIDIKGPVYDSANRPLYVMVLIDCYTKFVMTKATTSITSKTVIQFLSNAFSIFGNCTILTSDNGPQFISHEFVTFLRGRGIIQRRSSVFNAQSNGVVERFNKNISKLVDNTDFSNCDSLQQSLNIYVQNYNATKHSSTEFSPSDLMFKFSVKTNLNMITDSDSAISTEAGQNLHKNCERSANYANDRRRPRWKVPFSVGDYIVTKQGKTRKLVSQMGPYTFKMSDGFSVNVRNIARKAKMIENNELEIPIRQDISFPSDFTECEISPNSEETRARNDRGCSIRKSSRDRRAPAYLRDFVSN